MTLKGEDIIKEDKRKIKLFDSILNEIQANNFAYFNKRNDRFQYIKECYILIRSKNPSTFNLKYVEVSNLDEKISELVFKKYKEIFE